MALCTKRWYHAPQMAHHQIRNTVETSMQGWTGTKIRLFYWAWTSPNHANTGSEIGHTGKKMATNAPKMAHTSLNWAE